MLAETHKDKWQRLAGIKITESQEVEETKTILKEGRYDDVVGKIVDDIWKFIKESRKNYDNNPLKNQMQSTEKYIESADISQHDGGEEGGMHIDSNTKGAYYSYVATPPEKSKLKFTLVLHAFRDKAIDSPFRISSETGTDDIEILIQLNPIVEQRGYNELNAKLQNLIRHEFEHLTQSSDEDAESAKPEKQLPGDDKMKATIHAMMSKIEAGGISEKEKEDMSNSLVTFFTFPDEIPALVQGLYREAKTKKAPLDIIFREYLEEFSNVLTNKAVNSIENEWIKYAAKNLPAAQYSERGKNKLAIFRDKILSDKY